MEENSEPTTTKTQHASNLEQRHIFLCTSSISLLSLIKRHTGYLGSEMLYGGVNTQINFSQW